MVLLSQNTIPAEYYAHLDAIRIAGVYLVDIYSNQAFTNVNLSDNISMAISKAVIIDTNTAPFTAEGALIFERDIIVLVDFLKEVITYINHVLWYLDKIILNLSGVLAERALDQYIELHGVGTKIMQHYTILADYISVPVESRVTLLAHR